MTELILMLITGIWVLIGAIKIMPYFADKKMTRKGGKIDKLEQGFHRRLDGIEERIPIAIPTLGDIMVEVRAERAKTTKNLEAFQKSIPNLLIQTVQTKEFETAVKSYEGRMYRAKGIDMAEAQKGIDAAQQIFIEKIQNQDPNHQERNETLLIIKDTIKLAEQGGLIEEGSVDAKMGIVQGVFGIIDKLEKRNNGNQSSSPIRGGFSPPRLSGGGSEVDSYYG